jgi:hypothetical protein
VYQKKSFMLAKCLFSYNEHSSEQAYEHIELGRHSLKCILHASHQNVKVQTLKKITDVFITVLEINNGPGGED